MIVALSQIRVKVDGRRQAEPCPHCRHGGLQGSGRPGVDEFGRRGKYCERCGRWTPDLAPGRSPCPAPHRIQAALPACQFALHVRGP